jgi:hypothetical protein
MAEQKTKHQWQCPGCPKTFRTEAAMATHFDKECATSVDDSFYENASTTITLIP